MDIKDGTELVADENSFNSILCLDGNALLSSKAGDLEIKKGDSVFVPASEGKYIVKGECELILTMVP